MVNDKEKSNHPINKKHFLSSGKKNYLSINYANKKAVKPYDYLLIAHILNLSGMSDGGCVLDLACGTGSFKSVFESFKYKYTGVDIDNNDMLNNIYQCDIASSELPFEDQSYDLIFFKMGIEHLTISEISNCLAEALRVLKPNGNLVVITPDWKWTYKTFYEEYTHQTPFTESSLKSALQMANFDIKICSTIIQLPIVWSLPFVKIFMNLLSLLYPIFPKNKFVKYSKERVLLAIAKKQSL